MSIQVVSGSSTAAEGWTTALAIATLVNRAYTVAEEGMWRVPQDRTSEAEVSQRLHRDQVLVALDGERVAGAVFTEVLPSGHGWLGALAVDPSNGGGGCGTALVSACEARALAGGAGAMLLDVLAPHEGHPHTDRLWHWYQRLGFREYERGPLAQYDPDVAVEFVGACDLVRLRHSF